jgi:hypothetical protein
MTRGIVVLAATLLAEAERQAEAVTSPLIVGERQRFGESIEPDGFHGCFWVVPRPALGVLLEVDLDGRPAEHACHWKA